MGSLRSSSLAQLSRGNGSPNSSSMSTGTFLGFNSTVGGGRLTPTAPSASGNNVASNNSVMTGFSAGGSFSGPGLGFGGSTSNFSGSLAGHSSSGRQSTFGMNLLQTSASNLGRSSLFTRDRSKIESIGTFDPSEFPSLGSRESSAPNASLSSRSNYVGMVKQPAIETSEFQMSNEDFPALPGPSPSISSSASNSASMPATYGNSGAALAHHDSGHSIGESKCIIGSQEITTTNSSSIDNQHLKRGILTSPDGRVTNIPPSMVTDQFGMIGLLTFIRAAETDPNLVSLALGADLTTLGLNLNSENNLYPTFGGPWAETPCRPQDIDYNVPFEYLINSTIREKLAPVKLNRYKDDVLFYMFYTNIGDVLQLAAAAELYNRDWRYHKEDKVWITRAPGMPPSEKTSTYERGTYYFFDVNNWRKVPKEFHLDYDKLEDRPSLPANLTGAGNPGGHSSASSSPAPTGIHQLAQTSQLSPVRPVPGPKS